MINFLAAAYVFIFAIHIVYFWSLRSRTKALNEELAQLERRLKG